jgi:NADH-quinone oxidoreductase subunit L
MHGEQNIKNMGNLWRKIPITYIAMWIGVLSLIGVTGFSGFYSKEVILGSLYNSNSSVAYLAYIAAMSTIFFTAFYSFRILTLVFHGAEKNSNIDAHESSWGILLVLIILSVFATLFGSVFYSDFVGENSTIFWKSTIFIPDNKILENIDPSIELYSIILILASAFIVYILYIRDKKLSTMLAKMFPLIYRIIYNKFYLDSIYNFVIVKTFNNLAKGLRKTDDAVVDYYGANTVSGSLVRLARYLTKFQTGYTNFYAFIMVVGLLIILTYYLLFLEIK